MTLGYAITIDTPYSWDSGGNASLSWHSTPADPPIFRPKLLHPTLLSEPCYLADFIYTTVERYYLVVPSLIPGDGYYVKFVNVNDRKVYALSGVFSIGEHLPNSDTGFSSPSVPETPQPGPGTIIVTIFSTVTVPASVVTVAQTITTTTSPNVTTTALNTISRGFKSTASYGLMFPLILITISWTHLWQ
ncbi:hypothetical protein FRC16_001688 [Serendipita sp. 398]|nr:hypothetical protein FRC16_001688 [Serendipita sp. 398]